MAARRVRGQPHTRPNSIGAHIGMRLRLRRRYLDVTVQELANLLRVSQSDLTSMETGDVPIDASFVARCAQALEVPIAWFYDGIETSLLTSLDGPGKTADAAAREITEALNQKTQGELLQVYFEQMNGDDRKRIVAVARAFVSDDSEPRE